MQISELRDYVSGRLIAFAWDQWAQMGVLGASQRRNRWSADPEALLLFTFEAGRGDARLFDEVLDWLLVNERLVSVQRLRNLCRDEIDRELAQASLDWVGQWRPRARLVTKNRHEPPGAPSALFRGPRIAIARPDDAFEKHGWLKPASEPSRKSQSPDLLAPINLSFRLRQILGVGARAEVVRVLLTTGAVRMTAQAITTPAAYAKRNVHDALASLHAAGVVETFAVGKERRYGIERERWAALLGLSVDELPVRRDWPQLLYAMRLLTRWLEDESHAALSPYMLASEARVLANQLEPELLFAGVHFSAAGPAGADYWQRFADQAKAAVDALT
jgi:hypothetical protein